MLESLFWIIEASPEAEVEISDQPFEMGVDDQSKVESDSHPIEEGETTPMEEEPLPMEV